MQLLFGLLVVSAIVLIVGVVAHLSWAHQTWHTWFMGAGTIGVIVTGGALLWQRGPGASA